MPFYEPFIMYYQRPLLCWTHAWLRPSNLCRPTVWATRRTMSLLEGPPFMNSPARTYVSSRTRSWPNSQNRVGGVRLYAKQDDSSGRNDRNNDNSDDDVAESQAKTTDAPLSPFSAKERTPEEWKEIEENKIIEAEVQKWLRQVIVGLNLCPFAERPLRENNLRLFTVRGNDEETLLSSILVLLHLQESKPGTSLIICPECYPDDFEKYLDVVDKIENHLLPEYDFDGILQVAPFHPQFRFEGSLDGSVDNWTNRSPYPIFHIIREDEVTRAADAMDGDASRVWKRNVGLLEALHEELGGEVVERIFTCHATPDDQRRVDDILRRHRLVLRGER